MPPLDRSKPRDRQILASGAKVEEPENILSSLFESEDDTQDIFQIFALMSRPRQSVYQVTAFPPRLPRGVSAHHRLLAGDALLSVSQLEIYEIHDP